jgi:hypothetical protein
MITIDSWNLYVSQRKFLCGKIMYPTLSIVIYLAGSLIRPKVVRSVHYCPATKKVLERRYTDLTSFDAFPTSSVYPTKVCCVLCPLGVICLEHGWGCSLTWAGNVRQRKVLRVQRDVRMLLLVPVLVESSNFPTKTLLAASLSSNEAPLKMLEADRNLFIDCVTCVAPCLIYNMQFQWIVAFPLFSVWIHRPPKSETGCFTLVTAAPQM